MTDVAPLPVPSPTRLHVRVGHGPQGVFKLSRACDFAERVRVDHNVVEGYLDRWERFAVLAGKQDGARFYEFAPDPGADAELLGEGGFFVRGGFKVYAMLDPHR